MLELCKGLVTFLNLNNYAMLKNNVVLFSALFVVFFISSCSADLKKDAEIKQNTEQQNVAKKTAVTEQQNVAKKTAVTEQQNVAKKTAVTEQQNVAKKTATEDKLIESEWPIEANIDTKETTNQKVLVKNNETESDKISSIKYYKKLNNKYRKIEKYTIEVDAPLIKNNEFPVSLPYYNDLLTGKNKLKAILMIPMKLTITNSAQRRLFTIFTQKSKSTLKIGTKLIKVKQVFIEKNQERENDLAVFVGNNKQIYHTKKSKSKYIIKFFLPVNHKHFNDGFIKVSIASTNGIELTKICEKHITCIKPAFIKILPRYVHYNFDVANTSGFNRNKPKQKFTISSSNVNLLIKENGKKKTTIYYHKLPASFTVKYDAKKSKFNRSLIRKSFIVIKNNLDIYPIIPYMSSDKYSIDDVITITNLTSKQELTTQTINRVKKMSTKH
ncbi:MAG: hypothetical protein DRQ51_01235 [Gammaproteobacteria bacterium]|nr:MAG: hypothetical protein DRQ51_01235 [Gammaproteobacteria bacterium]